MTTHGLSGFGIRDPGFAGRYATTLRPVSFSRTTFVVRSTEEGRGKPPTCGLPESSSSCAAARDLGAPANSAFATALLMVAAGIPEPDSAVSNVMRSVWPAFGERGPVT